MPRHLAVNCSFDLQDTFTRDALVIPADSLITHAELFGESALTAQQSKHSFDGGFFGGFFGLIVHGGDSKPPVEKSQRAVDCQLNTIRQTAHMGKSNYLDALLEMQKAHPEIRPADLAARAGVSPQAAWKWFKTGGIEEHNLRVIAEAYDADYDELRLNRRYVPLGTRNVRPGPTMARQIPVLDWTLPRDWRNMIREPHSPHVSHMIPSTKKVSPDAFALVVRDDSMESTGGQSFPEGSTIIVDPDGEARHGSKVVARVKPDEELTFKQLVIDGGRRYLKPLNPRYPVIEIDRRTEIVGVVVQMFLDVEP